MEQNRVETTQPKYYHNIGVISHPGENHNVEADLCKNNGEKQQEPCDHRLHMGMYLPYPQSAGLLQQLKLTEPRSKSMCLMCSQLHHTTV